MKFLPDAQAMRNARLLPQTINAIMSVLRSRPITLARATYQTVAATKSGKFLTTVFPANSFEPGDQLVLRLYGTVRNPSAFVDTFFVEVDVLQNTSFQILSAVNAAIDHTTTNPVSWCLDAALACSIPRTDQQTFLWSAAKPIPAQGTIPSPNLMVGGYMNLTVTNASNLTATLTGGAPVSTATTGSYQVSTLDANNQTFDNTRQTFVSVQITNGSFNSFAVMGGYLLAV